MKQYLLTFLVAACAACSCIVSPVEARLQSDASATSATPPAPGASLVALQGGRPW